MLALYGAEGLKAMNLPGEATIIGMILLTAAVNLLIGSASAKWALIGPILVPMLMAVGISPELSQAAYRVGDSVSNIISPLMVFFPLSGLLSTLREVDRHWYTSLMMPFSIAMLIGWSIFLVLYWMVGIPLGIQAPYTYDVNDRILEKRAGRKVCAFCFEVLRKGASPKLMSCCSESDVGGNISLFIVTFLSGALCQSINLPHKTKFLCRALALAEQAELEGEVPGSGIS